MPRASLAKVGTEHTVVSNSPSELVDLFEATKYANERITAHILEHGVQYRLVVDG